MDILICCGIDFFCLEQADLDFAKFVKSACCSHYKWYNGTIDVYKCIELGWAFIDVILSLL